jgi:uracil-DNA glycosylase
MQNIEDFYRARASCTECELGVYRDGAGEFHVYGPHKPRSVLFILEAPLVDDIKDRGVLKSEAGVLLSVLLEKHNITQYNVAFLTACRSCAPVVDAHGLPVLNKRQLPIIRDITPSPKNIAACKSNLLEEIYLLDPLLIVTMGQVVADHVIRRGFTIGANDGRLVTIEIPGKLRKAHLTETKRQWWRRVHGEVKWPTLQNTVTYPVIPTLDLKFVSEHRNAMRLSDPLVRFNEHIMHAARIQHKYLEEIQSGYENKQ